MKTYFSRFQTKLLCAFILCTMIPLGIIGGISYKVSYKIAEDKIVNAAISSDEQLNMQFNDRLAQAEHVADSLQYDMYSLMQADSSREILSALTDCRNNASMFQSTFDFYCIRIFLPDTHIGANENLYFFPLSGLEAFTIPPSDLENPGTSSIWLFQSDVRIPFMLYSRNETRDTIACCRILKNPETQVLEYAYMIFLDAREFTQSLQDTFSYPDISSYLMDENGYIPAHNDKKQQYSRMKEKKLQSIKEQKNTVFKKDGVRYHAVQLQNGWYHVTEIPDSYISQNTRVLLKSILLTLLFSLPVTLLVILLLSKNLTRRIKGLSAAMEALQLDSPRTAKARLVPENKKPESYDEIDRLGLTFEKMQTSLDQNLQSILDLSLAEERLKYQLLQSQINPHFLYNILGSIQSCQSIGKLDTASQMLTNLTRFYRMTLRKSNDLISIRDELEIARLYLEMEKLCHNDNLSWEIQQDDGIENYLICKFTLQPFLENCILHGLSQLTPDIHIVIEIRYGVDTVLIYIRDNGIGIRENQLVELNHTLQEKIVNYNKHFGIGNVNKRIASPHFGNGRITMDSRPQYGTAVTIEFDQMEEDDEKSDDCG